VLTVLTTSHSGAALESLRERIELLDKRPITATTAAVTHDMWLALLQRKCDLKAELEV
jgi:hypothetical protein